MGKECEHSDSRQNKGHVIKEVALRQVRTEPGNNRVSKTFEKRQTAAARISIIYIKMVEDLTAVSTLAKTVIAMMEILKM